jgi:phosphoglycolate phosphatase
VETGLSARLIFDLDGTLVHSAPTLAAAANALLDELGRAPLPVETCLGFVGHGAARLVQGVLETSGGLPEAGLAPQVARFRTIYGSSPVEGTTAYPHVADTLRIFAAEGHGLGVCTQKPDAPALAILRALRLMPPITSFTGGDTLDVLKPDPRMLFHAAGQLPEGPVVYVGDSETDAATAAAAGVPFLLYTEGYRRGPVSAIAHDAAFDDFRRLPSIVADVLATSAPT